MDKLVLLESHLMCNGSANLLEIGNTDGNLELTGQAIAKKWLSEEPLMWWHQINFNLDL